MSYLTDRRFGDRFIPLAKALIGPHLLKVSPFEIDAKRAADLILLRAEPLDIGVRIRRPKYHRRDDFTIRAKRDSGVETEYSKIINGFMDWFFYGWAVSEHGEPRLHRWLLIDMSWFRKCMHVRGLQYCLDTQFGGRPIVDRRDNGDGTYLYGFQWRPFGPNLIVAASDYFYRARLASGPPPEQLSMF